MIDGVVKLGLLGAAGWASAAVVGAGPIWEQVIEKGGFAALAIAVVAALVRWFERVLDRWQAATGDQLKMVLAALDANRETNAQVAGAIRTMTEQQQRVERLLEGCAMSQRRDR